jgi:phosphoribosyl-ATP pyrophosphohydrolase/phosphoribosyl-AMP cyclohydrolase
MQIDYDKYSDGLVPAVVQDASTKRVLMLGFMNEEAVEQTRESGKVTFYSRSKQRLWTKGEESGNSLIFKEMSVDCDRDTLLIKALPKGPVCHTGSDTCWGEQNIDGLEFLETLEAVIEQRLNSADAGSSYVARLASKGVGKVAQKVGEEAVEVVIEAMDEDSTDLLEESADLLFHYLVLLKFKGHGLQDVIEVLKGRHK